MPRPDSLPAPLRDTRGFRSVVRTLRNQDLLDDTAIAFVSDNGYFFGEYRIPDKKHAPHDPSLRVPLAIYAPGEDGTGSAEEGEQDEIEELVSTVDVAATLLDYAQARPCPRRDRCRRMDGRSLRPLLSGEDESWPSDRAIPIELDDGFTYRALRTLDHLYVELEGDRSRVLRRPHVELYDLEADPDQLRNLWHEDRPAARSLRRELAPRLRTLSRCAGTAPSAPRPCE